MKTIIFDVETTGLLKTGAPLEQQPQIIELGAIYLNEGVVSAELTQLLDPGCVLPPIITKITGIKDKDLVGMPTFKKYLSQLINFFSDADMLIAHNAPFDVGMLKNELVRVDCIDFPWPKEIVCTVQEYRAFMGKWPKMTELYSKVMGKPLEQTHRALDDCIALNEILTKGDFYMKVSTAIREDSNEAHGRAIDRQG